MTRQTYTGSDVASWVYGVRGRYVDVTEFGLSNNYKEENVRSDVLADAAVDRQRVPEDKSCIARDVSITRIKIEDYWYVRRAIRAPAIAMARIYIKPYLITIHRRCLFCLIEYRGGWICFDGRNQTVKRICQPEENVWSDMTRT